MRQKAPENPGVPLDDVVKKDLLAQANCIEGKDPKLKDITDVFGRYGCWQKIIIAFLFSVSIFGAWNNLVITFLAPDIDYWCSRPSEFHNVSIKDWQNFSSPLEEKNGLLRYSRCSKYSDLTYENGAMHHGNGTTNCDAWEFDTSTYRATIVSKWNLVCQDEWLISMSQTVYMAGYMTSMLVFGQLSDRVGRRPIIVLAITILILSSFSMLFATKFTIFAALRFFICMGISGTSSTGFVLLLESVGPEHRSRLGMSMQFGWATGYVILPLIAWLLRDWYYILVSVTTPSVILALFLWFIPESVRWLVAQEHYEKASHFASIGAKKNGIEVTNVKLALEEFKQDIDEEEEGKKKRRQATILDLLRTPNMRKKTLDLYFCWFVNSFVYYALSLNTNRLEGDPFINFFIAGAVEFPAYLASIFIIKRFGRRKCQMTTMVIGGVSCLLTIAIPTDHVWWRIILANVGKLCITASFAILYIYSAEIYPTVVRTIGMGTSSMCARVGSMVAPFVKEIGRATHPAIPYTIFGTLSIISGLLVQILPETNGKKLPDTIAEGEVFGMNNKEELIQVVHFMKQDLEKSEGAL